jgi:hypothetical protein
MTTIEYLFRTLHAMGADTATAIIACLACLGVFFVLESFDKYMTSREERYQDRMIEYAKSDAQWANELFVPLYEVEESARKAKAALQNEARWDDPYFIDIVKGFDRDDR